MSDITKVGVIGAGLMGSGIAEVIARAGIDVLVREINDDALSAGSARIGKSLDRGVSSGKLSAEDRDAAAGHLSYTTALADLADRDLVIEAATENPEIKFALFAELDQAVKRPDAILATNTSSLSVIDVARATSRPAQIFGLSDRGAVEPARVVGGGHRAGHRHAIGHTEPARDRGERFPVRVGARADERKLRVGNGLDPEVNLGPLISRKQLDRVLQYVDIGSKEGD